VVAFVLSVVILVLLVAPIGWYTKRRPVGTWMSWGEAMAAGTYVFFIMFWAYGVVPHQWLTLADGDWQWRPDRIIVGWGGFLQDWLPFEMSYQTMRDIVGVLIYVVVLGGNIALWAKWQGRGDVKPGDDIEKSRYGRPLVKQG
jgi:hypothetical protein